MPETTELVRLPGLESVQMTAKPSGGHWIERSAGKRLMVLSTDPRMRAAHRLYERLGFTRLPERDWSPVDEVDLLVYARDL